MDGCSQDTFGQRYSLEDHRTSIFLVYVMVRWKNYDTAKTVPLEILNLNHRTSAFLLALQDTNPRNHSLIKGPKEKTTGGAQLSFCTKSSPDSTLPFPTNPVNLHFSDKGITVTQNIRLIFFFRQEFIFLSTHRNVG